MPTSRTSAPATAPVSATVSATGSVTATGHPPSPGSRFVAHGLAVSAAASVFRLVANVGPAYRDLADQARRAAASVPLNLAEGAGRFGRDRLQHYRIAYGSGREAACAVELLVALGAVAPTAGRSVLAALDRVLAITWRLCHPRR